MLQKLAAIAATLAAIGTAAPATAQQKMANLPQVAQTAPRTITVPPNYGAAAVSQCPDWDSCTAEERLQIAKDLCGKDWKGRWKASDVQKLGYDKLSKRDFYARVGTDCTLTDEDSSTARNDDPDDQQTAGGDPQQLAGRYDRRRGGSRHQPTCPHGRVWSDKWGMCQTEMTPRRLSPEEKDRLASCERIVEKEVRVGRKVKVFQRCG